MKTSNPNSHLRAVAEQLEALGHVRVDLVFADPDVATGRSLLGDDDLHSGGLARAVVPQQSENLDICSNI